MHRQTLLIVIVGVLVIASALFLGWATLRTVPPAVAPPTPPSIQATATPAEMPISKRGEQGGGELNLDLLTMTLPTDWQFLRNEWPDTAPAGLEASPPMVAAWPDGETFSEASLRFTLFSITRNALSLQQYASDVAAELSATAGVSDIETSIDATFRGDTLPVTHIRYTQETPTGRIHGHQVATFDATGDHIVIATLVQQENNVDTEQLMRTLVGSMHFVADQ